MGLEGCQQLLSLLAPAAALLQPAWRQAAGEAVHDVSHGLRKAWWSRARLGGRVLVLLLHSAGGPGADVSRDE